MVHEINMPQLGLTMTEGTIRKWLKNVGDKVNKGDILVEIETDKIISEIESEFNGFLLKIIQKEGDEVPVKGALALIGDRKEDIVNDTEKSVTGTVITKLKAPILPAIPEPAPVFVQFTDDIMTSGGRIKVSPLARKMAKERDISLSDLVGSGPGGRIVKRDIDNYKKVISSSPVSPVFTTDTDLLSPVLISNERREKMSSMRKVVATRMLQSHTNIPCVTQTVKADVTQLLVLRKELNQDRNVEQHISVNDFILKATSKALSLHKEMLVSIDGDDIIYHDDVNLGMAVGLDSGLIVPVIRKADFLSLSHLSKTAKILAEKARNGRLQAEDYYGSTFTVSNLGMYGIETFTPIINHPDAAILGVCAVQNELTLNNEGNLVTTHVMRLSLSFDHRLLDGVVVAKFQQTLTQLLSNPMNILL